MVTLLNIRCFVAAACVQNFTKAADRLFMSRQAVSQQIFQLENSLGVKLFERMPNKLVLTPAGEAYKRVLSDFLNDLSDVRSHYEGAEEGMYPVSIGVMRTLEVWEELWQIKQYCIDQGRIPDLRINIYEPHELNKYMTEGMLDIVFSMPLQVLGDRKNFDFCIYAYKPQVMLISKHLPAVKNSGDVITNALKIMPVAGWASENFSLNMASTFVKNWRKSGLDIQSMKNYVNADSAVAAAIRGECCVICPAECIWTNYKELAVYDIPKQLDYYAIWRNKPSNPGSRMFTDRMKEVLREKVGPLNLIPITPIDQF